MVVELKRTEDSGHMELQALLAPPSASGRDWTRYVVSTPDTRTAPLRKRQAIRTLVLALHAAGVPTEQLASVLPGAKFLRIDGRHTGDELKLAPGPNFGVEAD